MTRDLRYDGVRVRWSAEPAYDVAFITLPTWSQEPSRDATDRPTTQETPTVTTPPTATISLAELTTPVPTTVEPLRLTLGMLRALGACSPNLRNFGREFPESRFPTGVPLNEETCHQHYRTWDWDWARSVFLNDAGQREWFTVVNSETRETRDRWGTGNARRARVTGHLLATRPEYRSERLLESARTAATHDDDRLVRAVERGRRDVDEARRRVDEWTRALAQREAQLPELEEAARGATARLARRRLEAEEVELARYEREVERQRADLERRRTALEARRAELAAAETTDPGPTPTSPPEPGARTEPGPIQLTDVELMF